MRRQYLFALLVGAHILIAAAIHSQPSPDPKRRTVGVAFGGGSARGFAHVGVIRWFEEHHIPIDFVAGTSMGGLVGGAYASGMSSAELAVLARHGGVRARARIRGHRHRPVEQRPLDDHRALPRAARRGTLITRMQ